MHETQPVLGPTDADHPLDVQGVVFSIEPKQPQVPQ
jgi:hypothetical protein